jgi:putative resolvase
MKLSAYARQIGVTYKTVYRWWKAGKLDAYQLETGTVIVSDPLPKNARGVALKSAEIGSSSGLPHPDS